MGDANQEMLNKLDRGALKKLSQDQLCEIVLILLERDRKLTLRVEDLERRLNQNSNNSSKPPSSDMPGTPRAPKDSPSGKKPGGQVGHQANFRQPFSRARVDKFEPVVPERCGHCDARLKGLDKHPRRHQVVELPPIVLRVTEYLLHALRCRNCGHVTRAKLPAGVSPRLMGPHLSAVTVMLSGCFRMSKREVQSLLKALFELEVSLGAVSDCEKAAAQALVPSVEKARDYAQAQSVGNMDETGWKERRKLAWLWTLVTPQVTVFQVHANRSKGAMKNLLGSFAGVLTSDRFGAYNSYPGKRQLCWAHLVRDFEAFRAMRGKPGSIGRRLQTRAKRLFILWHKVRAGTLSRKKFRNRLPYHRQLLESLLREGASLIHGKNISRTCRRILKWKKSLWTFAQITGVEPTNNAAERALRPAVLWRKGSFGTHSEQGSRFAESMLTVRATLKQQKRDLLSFLTQALQAAISTAKAPSLLPHLARKSA